MFVLIRFHGSNHFRCPADRDFQNRFPYFSTEFDFEIRISLYIPFSYLII
jgi:hypothetical protein